MNLPRGYAKKHVFTPEEVRLFTEYQAGPNFRRGVRLSSCWTPELKKRYKTWSRIRTSAAYRNTPKGKYIDYQYRAKKWSIKFELSLESFKMLIESDCWYCGAIVADSFNGVDRVNNDKEIGYVEENVVSSCWRCNSFKGMVPDHIFRRYFELRWIRVEFPPCLEMRHVQEQLQRRWPTKFSVSSKCNMTYRKRERRYIFTDEEEVEFEEVHNRPRPHGTTLPSHWSENTRKRYNVWRARNHNNSARIRYRSYKTRAKRKGIPFDMDFALFERLISCCCFYCDSAPDPFNGVDRVNNDNDVGYVPINVIASCENCNKQKNKIPNYIFQRWFEFFCSGTPVQA